jgi:hypothetical protein
LRISNGVLDHVVVTCLPLRAGDPLEDFRGFVRAADGTPSWLSGCVEAAIQAQHSRAEIAARRILHARRPPSKEISNRQMLNP